MDTSLRMERFFSLPTGMQNPETELTPTPDPVVKQLFTHMQAYGVYEKEQKVSELERKIMRLERRIKRSIYWLTCQTTKYEYMDLLEACVEHFYNTLNK